MAEVKVDLPAYCNMATAKVVTRGNPECQHVFDKTETSLLVTWHCPKCHKELTCEVYE